MFRILSIFILAEIKYSLANADVYESYVKLEALAANHIEGYVSQIVIKNNSSQEKRQLCDTNTLLQATAWFQMWINVMHCFMFSVKDSNIILEIDYTEWEKFYMNDVADKTNMMIEAGANHTIQELPQALTMRRFVNELINKNTKTGGNSAIIIAGEQLNAHIKAVSRNIECLLKLFRSNCGFGSEKDQLVFEQLEILLADTKNIDDSMNGLLTIWSKLEQQNDFTAAVIPETIIANQ